MQLTDAELGELGEIALAVARDAAALLIEGYRARPAATEKARADLVTDFDPRSEERILDRLGRLSDLPVVAEEGGGNADAPTLWYCDPLDGTANFVHGHPFWAVSIGLLSNGRPLAGAVVAPALGTEWTHERGARRDGSPCHVSDTARLDDALLATGFPFDRTTSPANNIDAFGTVLRRVRGIRRCGSAAIDCCLVADGTYDGYWERRLNGWDLAAGSAVALRGGATLTALDGGSPDVRVGHIALTNGRIHASLLALL
jgi:myo-inositol-1(or 4)-monophosphatase